MNMVSPSEVPLSQALAGINFLKSLEYPGRGIILGLNQTGQYAVQVYFVTEESENFKNMVLIKEDFGTVKTDFFKPDPKSNAKLVIYDAMRQKQLNKNIYLSAVSNGHQTSTLLEMNPLLKFKANWSYEPDEPNFTPRIIGVTRLVGGILLNQLAILYKGNTIPKMKNFQVKHFPGIGTCIHTYTGENVKPLPSFQTKLDPYQVYLKGGIDEISETFWDALNPEYRVSLAVKFINLNNPNDDVQIKIINKNQ